MKSEHQEIPIGDFKPNPWNDNRMSPKLYEKERRSIRDFGFIDPITCRPMPDGTMQILDGEHRWRAASEEHAAGSSYLDELPATVLLDCDDRTAKKLTIILNRLRGQSQQQELTAALIADLAPDGVEDLSLHLPFEDGEIRVLLDLAAGAWDLNAEPKAPASTDPDEWATLKVRIPKEATSVIERALDGVAKELGNAGTRESKRGLALEALAADYLAGHPQVTKTTRKPKATPTTPETATSTADAIPGDSRAES